MITIVQNGDEFEIVWESQYGLEVVDTAETEEEAEFLVGEYQLAFGASA